MTDPKSMVYRASSPGGLSNSFNEIQAKQDEDVRLQLVGILRKYRMELGFDAASERFDGRTVAQVLGDFTFAELQALQHRRSLWRQARGAAMSSGVEDVQGLACPKCKGSLLLKFDPQSPQTDGSVAGCLKIDCEACVAGTCIDGMDETPAWVAQLGQSIRTAPL